MIESSLLSNELTLRIVRIEKIRQFRCTCTCKANRAMEL